MSGPSHVATLVGDPARPSLTPALAAKAIAALPQPLAPVDWLAEGVAADLAFDVPDGGSAAAVAAAVRRALGEAALDVFVQPAAHRRKKLLMADMDSTMIGQECIDELADCAGLKSRVAAITARAMRGEVAFEPALRERVACLKGLRLADVDDVLRHRITPTPGAATLVRTMNASGAFTALVSGGFTAFTGPVAAMLGFAFNRANTLETAADVLTGTVAEPIVGREAKRATLLELRARLGIGPADVLAVGDGANDLAMIAEAGLGVAFRAKPAVAVVAGACIVHGDLTALLYAQGYRRREFVA